MRDRYPRNKYTGNSTWTTLAYCQQVAPRWRNPRALQSYPESLDHPGKWFAQGALWQASPGRTCVNGEEEAGARSLGARLSLSYLSDFPGPPQNSA